MPSLLIYIIAALGIRLIYAGCKGLYGLHEALKRIDIEGLDVGGVKRALTMDAVTGIVLITVAVYLVPL